LKWLASKPFQKRLEQKSQVTFRFEDLIPKPYRRDQPAQRLWHNPFQKRLDRKLQQQRGRRDKTEQQLWLNG